MRNGVGGRKEEKRNTFYYSLKAIFSNKILQLQFFSKFANKKIFIHKLFVELLHLSFLHTIIMIWGNKIELKYK